MQGRKKEAEDYARTGLKSLTVWVKPELPRQIKILAAERQMSVQALVTEFLNDGLAKYEKARVE